MIDPWIVRELKIMCDDLRLERDSGQCVPKIVSEKSTMQRRFSPRLKNVPTKSYGTSPKKKSTMQRRFSPRLKNVPRKCYGTVRKVLLVDPINTINQEAQIFGSRMEIGSSNNYSCSNPCSENILPNSRMEMEGVASDLGCNEVHDKIKEFQTAIFEGDDVEFSYGSCINDQVPMDFDQSPTNENEPASNHLQGATLQRNFGQCVQKIVSEKSTMHRRSSPRLKNVVRKYYGSSRKMSLDKTLESNEERQNFGPLEDASSLSNMTGDIACQSSLNKPYSENMSLSSGIEMARAEDFDWRSGTNSSLISLASGYKEGCNKAADVHGFSKSVRSGVELNSQTYINCQVPMGFPQFTSNGGSDNHDHKTLQRNLRQCVRNMLSVDSTTKRRCSPRLKDIPRQYYGAYNNVSIEKEKPEKINQERRCSGLLERWNLSNATGESACKYDFNGPSDEIILPNSMSTNFQSLNNSSRPHKSIFDQSAINLNLVDLASGCNKACNEVMDLTEYSKSMANSVELNSKGFINDQFSMELCHFQRNVGSADHVRGATSGKNYGLCVQKILPEESTMRRRYSPRLKNVPRKYYGTSHKDSLDKLVEVNKGHSFGPLKKLDLLSVIGEEACQCSLSKPLGEKILSNRRAEMVEAEVFDRSVRNLNLIGSASGYNEACNGVMDAQDFGQSVEYYVELGCRSYINGQVSKESQHFPNNEGTENHMQGAPMERNSWQCVQRILSEMSITRRRRSSPRLSITQRRSSPRLKKIQYNHGHPSVLSSEKPRLVCKDISKGIEDLCIPVSNAVDDSPAPSDFTYSNSIKVSKNVRLPPNATGCKCNGSCMNPKTCACAQLNGFDIPYVHKDGGRLFEAKDVVFECGPNCGCGPGCINRTSQRGLKYQLEVFHTPNKGWGVLTRDFIPSGAPVCEYTGLLRRTNELDNAVENDFILEIDCWQTINEIEGRERRLGDVSESLNLNLEKIDEKGSTDEPEFCIDASSIGNVARFINHSCEPNLFVQCVLSSHHDIRLPRVVLFAGESIAPLQELTYDYGYILDSVVGDDGQIIEKPCYCGTKDCRKRLY